MPEKKPVRIIVDTNIWIGFLIGKSFSGLKDLLVQQDVVLITSHELLEELREVTQRPKFQKYFPAQKVDELFQLLDIISENISLTSEVTICRDAKDNFLLSLAKDGEAHYLISGDEDLLVLKEFENTKIITYSAFQTLNL